MTIFTKKEHDELTKVIKIDVQKFKKRRAKAYEAYKQATEIWNNEGTGGQHKVITLILKSLEHILGGK